MFKSHLEMIGRNETPSKKAKFWQSYIRSLKGSEDIRAHEAPKARVMRPLSTMPEFTSFRTTFNDDRATPAERISGAGYRYLPVHRDTYGYSPRPIYERYRPTHDVKAYDPERAWNEHLDRMADLERRYPSRFGLYLKDKPSSNVNPLPPLEYEPEDKPIKFDHHPGRHARAGSLPPVRDASPLRHFPREMSVPPLMPLSQRVRGTSLEPLLEDLFKRELPPHSQIKTPTPVKAERWPPRESEVAFDKEGIPIYRNPGAMQNLLNPSPNLPISAITRDPWWWKYPELRPTAHPGKAPSVHLRDSFLSPVKRNFLWKEHPLRPMGHLYSLF